MSAPVPISLLPRTDEFRENLAARLGDTAATAAVHLATIMASCVVLEDRLSSQPEYISAAFLEEVAATIASAVIKCFKALGLEEPDARHLTEAYIKDALDKAAP